MAQLVGQQQLKELFNGTRPIFLDVKGAPFKIGTDIKVVKVTDSTFDQKYMGRTGRVIYLEYSCGCGQSYPEDPMIGVQFPNNDKEEFWREELIEIESGTMTNP